MWDLLNDCELNPEKNPPQWARHRLKCKRQDMKNSRNIRQRIYGCLYHVFCGRFVIFSSSEIKSVAKHEIFSEYEFQFELFQLFLWISSLFFFHPPVGSGHKIRGYIYEYRIHIYITCLLMSLVYATKNRKTS